MTAILLSLTIIAAVALFLGAARHRTHGPMRAKLQIRRLLAACGESDSLGYFATRRDKSMFSRDDRAVVLYRVTGGVSLASGDPVGRPELGSAVASLARGRPGTTAGCRRSWAPVRGGCQGVCPRPASPSSPWATRPSLDPARFDLRRTSMSPVRHAVQRAAAPA